MSSNRWMVEYGMDSWMDRYMDGDISSALTQSLIATIIPCSCHHTLHIAQQPSLTSLDCVHL